jgi:ribonuclease HII
MLKLKYQKQLLEAGCDEAGRGCLAGPVFAAAVILPDRFRNKWLDDSKKLTEETRYRLRPVIEKEAVAFAVAMADHEEIDRINILNASFLAMHRAVAALKVTPGLLLIDGPYFRNNTTLPHQCLVEGDALYASIAAASILAKTYRDDFMAKLDEEFPCYGWKTNKGYGTRAHCEAIRMHGRCNYHRRSFHLKSEQAEITFPEEALLMNTIV